MDNIYIILVVVLFALAISDLVVGVSNDAVNFLNSAVGSKAAHFKVIMGIAALGIFVGATYSTGMMEVARKGIFHPGLFTFKEIMVLFLAVMITNILVLDIFNTFGMPTSTTVSIVFGLLGAAVGVAWIKISTNPDANQVLASYINSDKALQIIGGILLSVIVAFTIGALVQFLSRLLFSFDYTQRFKYFGAIWGGLAITSITYFIIIKGLKGSPYATHEVMVIYSGGDVLSWINNSLQASFSSVNDMLSSVKGRYIWHEETQTLSITMKEFAVVYFKEIIAVSFTIWTIILQIFIFLKINILKVIVFVGTFALALAFAGNDLVNFIGVPIAGYKAFGYWVASGEAADSFNMAKLAGDNVPTEMYILVAASLIMIITLWFSKKSRAVLKTSLDLSRQDEGEERFGSSIMARNIVRGTRKTFKVINKYTPAVISKSIEKQFDTTSFKKQQALDADPPAFDMIRASVNLVVASILIAIGTSYKLPLSTTYVTFMVAMGTSLSDKAWSRESAVFRITGVISVIGGWFFTAFIGFTSAFIVAVLFSYGSFYAIFAMLGIAIFSLVKTNFMHKKNSKKVIQDDIQDLKEDNVLAKCTSNVIGTLSSINDIYDNLILGLEQEDRKILKDVKKDIKVINKQSKYLKDNVYKTIKKFDKDSIATSHFYVQVLDYLRETAHCLEYMIKPSIEHVDNDFTRLLDIQFDELKLTSNKIRDFYNKIFDVIKTKNYEQVTDIIKQREKLIVEIEVNRKLQIKRLKHNELGSKNSILYLGLLHETKNLLLHTVNLLKAQRDFDDFKKKE